MAFETSAGYPAGRPRLPHLNVGDRSLSPVPRLQSPAKQAREKKIAQAKMKKLSQALARRP